MTLTRGPEGVRNKGNWLYSAELFTCFFNPLNPKAKRHFLQIQDYKLNVHVWYTILKLLMSVFHNWYNYE